MNQEKIVFLWLIPSILTLNLSTPIVQIDFTKKMLPRSQKGGSQVEFFVIEHSYSGTRILRSLVDN
ncbi:hypothetical protein RhiirB3_416188 [Rhizophagus irregularis]|nr:hypothetical protein RhiirB3_409172 [Rhizophagus irregularis]PKY27605.1 hypothetical protein RhiirB3_416188 [Rhizophagus irregularis]